MEKTITYFENPGSENTDELISLVKEAVEATGIKYVAIASSTGASALKLNEALKELDVTIVNCSHHVGFKEANKAQMSDEMKSKLEEEGIVTFFGSHALSGVGKSISKKFGGVTPVEIIAAVYRTVCQGFKVCAEISIMLADAGLIPVGEEIIAIGGTGSGVDTAVIMTPANMTNVFDMRFHEIIAMPRP
ncbi:pyruvate kinase alpha/beta domain-containing protein [uncultured Methanobrevibacter sp.]|uniref:pyruvate kinase alpha/beta domain-containing protein n=1 Tax=uncultured Methanobrevibacter sp. TaxID=253161 RepID=UPI002637DE32